MIEKYQRVYLTRPRGAAFTLGEMRQLVRDADSINLPDDTYLETEPRAGATFRETVFFRASEPDS